MISQRIYVFKYILLALHLFLRCALTRRVSWPVSLFFSCMSNKNKIGAKIYLIISDLYFLVRTFFSPQCL